jgi:alcohol dehydrogenase
VEALVFEGSGRVVHRTDVPDPVPVDPGDAVVEVEAAGLCGSDLHPYLGREPARPGVVPGHEVVGRVAAVGPAVAGVRVGDRVVVPFSLSCGACVRCQAGLTARCVHAALLGWGDPDPAGAVLHGGQAALVRVPMADGSLVRVGEALPAGAALLLADTLPTGWAAVARGEVGPGAAVAVVGLGAVGLCAIVAARARGAARVVGIDPVAGRRAAAARLGAEVAAPDDAGALAAWRDVDVAVDAAGPPAAQRLAASLLVPGGTLSLIAVQTDAVFAVTPVEAYGANLRITAGRAPVRALLDVLLPLVRRGDLAVPDEVVITHPGRPLAEGPDLYRRFAEREPGLIKATFTPTRATPTRAAPNSVA